MNSISRAVLIGLAKQGVALQWLIVRHSLGGLPFGGKRAKSQGQPSNVMHSPLGNVPIPNVSFHEIIFQNWSLWERKVALKCGMTGRRYTYKKTMRNSKTLAAAFQNRFKLVKGDRMAIVLSNCPEYPIIVLAASQCGLVVTTVNPTYTIDEIQHQLEQCKTKMIVTEVKFHEKCLSVATALKIDIPVVVLRATTKEVIPEGGIDLFELFDPKLSGELKAVDILGSDDLLIPFSSGTTGPPKGVLLTHHNLVSNMAQISHPETAMLKPTTTFHQETTLAVLPMFHIYGLMITTFYSLKDGCRLITLPRFNPHVYISTVVRKKVNVLYLVPPILVLLAHEEIPGKYLKHVNFIVNGASVMSIAAANKILEKAEHVKIVQAYGMTESSPGLSHTSANRMQKLESIGIPVASTTFKIASTETGEALPKGERGELCALGPQLMKGYLNRPEETAEAFDKDGYLRTGDIAYYDDDGDFFIVDRMKELIKVKGFQVAPAELEEVLQNHPAIQEVAVVGVPDPEYGEVPRAFVIVREGSSLNEEEVKEFLKGKLSSYKQLRGGVVFVHELPKNQVGKVLRKELKNLYKSK